MITVRPGFTGNNGTTTDVLLDSTLDSCLKWSNAAAPINSVLMTIRTPVVTTPPVWTLTYWRPVYRPGIEIRRNGKTVYIDPPLNMTSQTPNPYPVPYYLQPVDVEKDLFDNTTRSLKTMLAGSITNTADETTPYINLNLPDFLVGVPMTRDIDWWIKSFSFDSGDIHAYGVQSANWTPGAEPDARLIYSETGMPNVTNPINIYYKRFTEPKFSISGDSYIWFFTRTPPEIALSQLGTIIGRGVNVRGAVFSESSKVLYGADRAFDGTFIHAGTSLTQTVSVTVPHWLQVQIPTNVTVRRYRMWAVADGPQNYKDAPIDWTLQGSLNGTEWTVLDTRVNSELPSRASNPPWPPVTLSEAHGSYIVNTPGSYNYYRIHVTKAGGATAARNNCMRIMEIEFLDN